VAVRQKTELCRFLQRLVHVPAEVLYHKNECLNAKITPFWTNVLEFVVCMVQYVVFEYLHTNYTRRRCSGADAEALMLAVKLLQHIISQLMTRSMEKRGGSKDSKE
jgi:hypothetical protein